MNKVCIAGGGLAGTYLAIALARRGVRVTLHERRSLAALTGLGYSPAQFDAVAPQPDQDRSIALALSHRGLQALRRLGLEAAALARARRMLGREIHLEHDATVFTAYDPVGAGRILAIARSDLFAVLLEAAGREPLIEIRQQSAIGDWAHQAGQVQVRSHDGSVAIYDALIGADGANSAIRASLQRAGAVFRRSDFGACYKQLNLRPRAGAFNEQAFHIWSRGELMLIGLPGARSGELDGTLFLPHARAAEWFATPAALQAQFGQHFPQVALDEADAQLMLARPLGNIYTIEGGPWHCGPVVLIGDAAHAMTPFFGQGMNCALEDCTVLLDCLDRHDGNWGAAFARFGARRRPDTDAIARLSLLNCEEMMAHTRTAAYAERKRLEARLTAMCPQSFVPIYSAITFGHMPYAKIMQLKQLQDALLDRLQAAAADADEDDSAGLLRAGLRDYQEQLNCRNWDQAA